jgi:hypothetical protein
VEATAFNSSTDIQRNAYHKSVVLSAYKGQPKSTTDAVSHEVMLKMESRGEKFSKAKTKTFIGMETDRYFEGKHIKTRRLHESIFVDITHPCLH